MLGGARSGFWSKMDEGMLVKPEQGRFPIVGGSESGLDGVQVGGVVVVAAAAMFGEASGRCIDEIGAVVQ